MGRIVGRKIKEFYALLLFMQPLGWFKIGMQLFCMVTVVIAVGALVGILSTKFTIFTIVITIIYLISILWRDLIEQ